MCIKNFMLFTVVTRFVQNGECCAANIPSRSNPISLFMFIKVIHLFFYLLPSFNLIKLLNYRRAIFTSSLVMKEDPIALAQAKEAPLKDINEMLAPDNKLDLITVNEKVNSFVNLTENVTVKNFLHPRSTLRPFRDFPRNISRPAWCASGNRWKTRCNRERTTPMAGKWSSKPESVGKILWWAGLLRNIIYLYEYLCLE